MDNQSQNQQFSNFPNQNVGGSVGGVNQPVQPYDANFQQKQPNKFLEFLKRHKIWFVIGGVGVVLAIVLAVILIPKGGGSGNGYTAQSGQELKVNEKSASFSVSVLGDLEKFSNKKGDEYVRLKVSVKNNLDETESFTLSYFELVDSSKNTVYKESSMMLAAIDGLEDALSEVGGGETKEGYLYFYSDREENEYKSKYMTDYTRLGEVAYLKEHIMSNAVATGSDHYNVSYEDYYLPIK